MPSVRARFRDGPVDGRLMSVELTAAGRLPDVVWLPQSGVYVGTTDEPAPLVHHCYVLVEEGDGDDEAEAQYQYRGPAATE